MEFISKVALITGGTSGIGFAVARKLAEKDAKIVIVGRNIEKGAQALAELKQIHSNVEFFSVDVTKSEQVKSVVNKERSKSNSSPFWWFGFSFQQCR